MTTTRPDAIESLSVAKHSHDLSHKSRRGDVDWLHAHGAAGQKNRTGSALLSLELTQDRAEYVPALNETIALVKLTAKKRGWPMHAVKARAIATEVVKHYINPACTSCKGRGLINVERDQPKQGPPKCCEKCGGSGVRPIKKQNQREVREILAIAHERRREIGEAIRKMMSRGPGA